MTSFQDAPDEAIKADEAKEACSSCSLSSSLEINTLTIVSRGVAIDSAIFRAHFNLL